MIDFESVTVTLEKWFDKPLRNLPLKLREHAKYVAFPKLWRKLTPEQRRSEAQQADLWNDPDLTVALAGSFEKPLHHLRENLRERVNRDFLRRLGTSCHRISGVARLSTPIIGSATISRWH